MNLLGILGQFLGAALGSVLETATQRLLNAVRESPPPVMQPPPTKVPEPIGKDRYVEGMLDQTERQRAKRLSEQMTAAARKRLSDWREQ